MSVQPSPASLLEDEVAFPATRPEGRVLVLACGAIAREVLAVIGLNGWTHVDLRCLPAKLHSRPERIPAAVDAKLTELAGNYERVFVAYADCGTGGALDVVLRRHDVERLPGAHCYGFLAGNDVWDAMHEQEPATFYLTDFLARHFDALVDLIIGAFQGAALGNLAARRDDRATIVALATTLATTMLAAEGSRLNGD